MGVCFLCDTKLYGERTRVCSSITPHSNVPYPEKIVELMGEEFVVIVTPADHMCKRCTSLLTHMDKLENDLKLVKNAMLSYIQKKYGILPPDQSVKTLDIVNGHLTKTDELEAGQRKVPSGLTVRDNSVNARDNPVNTSLKMMKTPQDNASKMKIYKCGFCTFQSKELGHVRFHMRSHMNKKGEGEKANQTVTKLPVTQPQKKRLYRCQVCSTSFDCRISCLDHIQKDHNQQTAATSHEEKETDNTRSVTNKINKPDILKSLVDQQSEPTIDADDGQEKNKGVVDTDMLLNDNVPTKDIDEPEKPKSTEEEETTVQGQNLSAGDEEMAQDESAEKDDLPAQEENSQVAMEVDQQSADNTEKEVENGGVENESGDLDIESMLAAIHNVNPPEDGGDAQNVP